MLCVIAFNLVMLAILEIPLLSYTFAPDWTPRAMQRVKEVLTRHGERILFIKVRGREEAPVCEPRIVATARSPRKQHALELFEELPKLYDELGAALSLFQDPRWRRAMVASVGAAADDRVLDVAAGTRARQCGLGRPLRVQGGGA